MSRAACAAPLPRLWAAVFWLLVTGNWILVSGDDKKPVDVTCPVDGTKFQAFEVVSRDYQLAWGGLDRDLCRHAFKTTPMEYTVWVCPSCRYSGLKADFAPGAAPTAAQKALLLEKLRPVVEIRKDAKQESIPGHAKFDLWAQVLAIKGAPAEQSARAWLYASWSARQQGAVYLADFDEWIELRRSLGLEILPVELGKRNRSELELEVAKSVEKRVQERAGTEARDRDAARDAEAALAELRKAAKPDADEVKRVEQRRSDARGRLNQLLLLRYTALHLFRRHGENPDALRWIEALAGSRGENSVIDDAVGRAARSIEIERTFQRKAAEGFEKAASAVTDRRPLGEIQYQLGELYRRLGEGARARTWYEKAIQTTPDDQIRKFATEQGALVR